MLLKESDIFLLGIVYKPFHVKLFWDHYKLCIYMWGFFWYVCVCTLVCKLGNLYARAKTKVQPSFTHWSSPCIFNWTLLVSSCPNWEDFGNKVEMIIFIEHWNSGKRRCASTDGQFGLLPDSANGFQCLWFINIQVLSLITSQQLLYNSFTSPIVTFIPIAMHFQLIYQNTCS